MTLTEERTAKNKRGAETREKLIDATVQLVAEWGPDAVNLRDIGREADQKNNSVVQFHFGTKEGVLAAAVTDRLPAVLDQHPSDADRRTIEFLGRMLASKTWAHLVHDHPLVADRFGLDHAARGRQFSVVIELAFLP